MSPYDESKGYLHSDSLRWSWGGLSGRPDGEWVRQTSHLPAKNMLNRLSDAGFSGIWLDRFGYKPDVSPERAIGAELGIQPLQRSDGRIAFYDIRAYTKRLRASERSSNARLREEYASHPAEVTFPAGCYSEEHNDKQIWRWCSKHGVMQIHNPLSLARTLKLSVLVQTGSSKPETILISTAGVSEKFAATINTVPYNQTIQVLPQGSVTMSFDCECEPVHAAGDPRSLYFALIDLQVVD